MLPPAGYRDSIFVRCRFFPTSSEETQKKSYRRKDYTVSISSRFRRSLAAMRVLLLVISAAACLFALTLANRLMPSAQAAGSTDIVISQVYGGGGNSGATLRNDFIELFNRGTVAVDVTGWSVQYAAAGGSSWQRTNLSGIIQPGQYYLVQQAAGTGGTVNLPTPNASGSIAMSATSGKVALVTNQALLSCGATAGNCFPNSAIKDFVGYGSSANNFEGAGPTPTLSNTTAALRAFDGCTDTDDNATDFSAGTPNPRNTSSPVHICDGPPALSIDDVVVVEGNSGTSTAAFTVSLSSPAPFGGVTFDIATADGTGASAATVADNDYVAHGLMGQTIAQGGQTYTFNVTINGDTIDEPDETFFVNVSNVIGATVTKGQGQGTITNDDTVPPAADVVISQVYGGGGNAGATLRNDFIELFNQGTTTANITGWSVQYNSATGSGNWQVTLLSGSIPPGGYYLVQQAQGAGGTTNLPTPNATGTIAMSATSGKVALINNSTPISGSCPSGASLVDLVGYGSANCFEGAGPAPTLSNTTAAFRKRGGCTDTDNNSADFSSGSPNPRNSASQNRDCTVQPPVLAIHTIQGSGQASPFVGQEVSTNGIVTARKTNGFFLQTPDANVDIDENTSEGIFVFTSSAPPLAVGDNVSVMGTVTEFFGLTEVSSMPGDMSITSSGNLLPAPVTLNTTILNPNGTIDQLERFEGMRLHAASLTTVSPTNEHGEVFTVLTGVARPFREPGVEASFTLPSGAPCCVPRFDENPERLMVDTDGQAGATSIALTSGVTLTG
ncbi:MAG TPA: lamin tail domain-containing protein, partial [Pyrinomonadaceae bacterium]|nr:lamin tail domain-containing protein [Pyrinomonadaceae bacterium]